MNFTKINALVVFLILAFSCSKKPILHQNYYLKGSVFGTTYSIKYLNGTKDYQKSIDSLFRLVNLSLSTYIPNSIISKINSGDTSVLVDDLFLEVFQKSKIIYKETNGYFDPTVGNLVNAWGFGPEKKQKNLTEQEIKTQMQWVGFDKVIIKARKVIKESPEIYLDVNSIAKGFGIDVIARFLNTKNITNYLIEIGGEIRAKGTKPNDIPWIIQLSDPTNTNNENGVKRINLSNKSMATSGNYIKYRVTDKGKKYVHIINPKTGQATESNLLSASVITDKDCADVDAYATAFMSMGLEKTKIFLKKHKNINAILLYMNDKNVLTEYTNYTYK